MDSGGIVANPTSCFEEVKQNEKPETKTREKGGEFLHTWRKRQKNRLRWLTVEL